MRIYLHNEFEEKIRRQRQICKHNIDLWNHYYNSDDEPDRIDELEKELINWIKDNTIGKAICDGNMEFSFELEEDLIMFKLTWGIE